MTRYVMRYVVFVNSRMSLRANARSALRPGKVTKQETVTFEATELFFREEAEKQWRKISDDKWGHKRDVEFRSLTRIEPVGWRPVD